MEPNTILALTGFVTILLAVVSFGMGIYSLFLNHKQAKVKEQMSELIKVTKDIRDRLPKK